MAEGALLRRATLMGRALGDEAFAAQLAQVRRDQRLAARLARASG